LRLGDDIGVQGSASETVWGTVTFGSDVLTNTVLRGTWRTLLLVKEGGGVTGVTTTGCCAAHCSGSVTVISRALDTSRPLGPARIGAIDRAAGSVTWLLLAVRSCACCSSILGAHVVVSGSGNGTTSACAGTAGPGSPWAPRAVDGGTGGAVGLGAGASGRVAIPCLTTNRGLRCTVDRGVDTASLTTIGGFITDGSVTRSGCTGVGFDGLDAAKGLIASVVSQTEVRGTDNRALPVAMFETIRLQETQILSTCKRIGTVTVSCTSWAIQWAVLLRGRGTRLLIGSVGTVGAGTASIRWECKDLIASVLGVVVTVTSSPRGPLLDAVTRASADLGSGTRHCPHSTIGPLTMLSVSGLLLSDAEGDGGSTSRTVATSSGVGILTVTVDTGRAVTGFRQGGRASSATTRWGSRLGSGSGLSASTTGSTGAPGGP